MSERENEASRFSMRPAEMRDAAQIAEIYNQGIRQRIATFETEERSAEERGRWLAAHDEHHPCLVAVDSTDNRVAGWVSADGYRPRQCYCGIAEFSVYVHEDYRGRGVGRIMMEAFIPACEQVGLWKLVSRIFPENMASRTLCRRVGFREVGVYEKHAQLDGVWKDVVIVERILPGTIENPPELW